MKEIVFFLLKKLHCFKTFDKMTKQRDKVIFKDFTFLILKNTDFNRMYNIFKLNFKVKGSGLSFDIG